jgi:serine/threonine protein kinase
MTAFYASIEQSNLEEAHSSYDIWSIGIILYNLMARKVPFPQIGPVKRADAIRTN